MEKTKQKILDAIVRFYESPDSSTLGIELDCILLEHNVALLREQNERIKGNTEAPKPNVHPVFVEILKAIGA